MSWFYEPCLSDFCAIWKLRNGQDISVSFSCWTKAEAQRAAHILEDLTTCKASVAPYEQLSAKCLPRLAWDRPYAIGWVVYFQGTPDDQDWNFEQLDGFDHWIKTVLVCNQGSAYLPTGRLRGDPEVSRRLKAFERVGRDYVTQMDELAALEDDDHYGQFVPDGDASFEKGMDD